MSALILSPNAISTMTGVLHFMTLFRGRIMGERKLRPNSLRVNSPHPRSAAARWVIGALAVLGLPLVAAAAGAKIGRAHV